MRAPGKRERRDGRSAVVLSGSSTPTPLGPQLGAGGNAAINDERLGGVHSARARNICGTISYRKPLSTCLDKIVREVHSLQARRNHRPEDEEDDMNFKRRDLLKASAAIAAASAAGGFSCIEIASAAPMSPPVVDRLSVRVLVDGAYNLFLQPGEVKGVKIERPPSPADFRGSIYNEWGVSCWLDLSTCFER